MLAALVLLAGSALLATARFLPDRSALERAAAAALVFPCLVVGLVEVLSPLGLIAAIPFLIGSGALLLVALALAGDAGREVIEDDLVALREMLVEIAQRPTRLAPFVVGLTSILFAIVVSYLLPPWAWDALGYHYPFVFDAIGEGTLRAVPTNVPYVNTYPHLGDVFLIGYRLSLLDGTFIEAAQLCYVPLAVCALTLLTRLAGVPTSRGFALSMLLITLPAASLQLCASYVDVEFVALTLATFAFAAGPIDGRTLLLFALAAGMTLGTKPSAPPLVTLASAWLLARAWRQGRTGEAVLACGLALAIGAWKYVENLAVHGNPIWPVTLTLGPIALPGRVTMDQLASMGLHGPMRDHGWLRRVFDSWTTVFPDRYVYDMRAGGFGPLFAFVLVPASVASCVAALRSERFRVRARAVATPVLLLTLATLATPGAYWARYTLGVPAALLVLSVAASQALPARLRAIGDATAALCAALGLVLAIPGYTAGGPAIVSFFALDAATREGAFGCDDREADFVRARALVRRDESFAYDASFPLPGRLYPLDGRARVVFMPDAPADADALVSFVDANRVRAIAISDTPELHASDQARSRPDRFRWLFQCPEDDPENPPCSVFEVLRAPAPEAAAGSRAPR